MLVNLVTITECLRSKKNERKRKKKSSPGSTLVTWLICKEQKYFSDELDMTSSIFFVSLFSISIKARLDKILR